MQDSVLKLAVVHAKLVIFALQVLRLPTKIPAAMRLTTARAGPVDASCLHQDSTLSVRTRTQMLAFHRMDPPQFPRALLKYLVTLATIVRRIQEFGFLAPPVPMAASQS
jgi:hypothetical protein